MSQSPNTDPDRAPTRPRAGIILVQPKVARYRTLVLCALTGDVDHVKELYGKANSDMIAAADRGPFSHSVLYHGDVAVDSRSGGRNAAIGRDSVAALERAGRAMSYYAYRPPDEPSEPGEPPEDGPARAVAAVLEFIRRTGAEAGVPISDEVNRFPVAAMVNLGLILVSSQRTGLRWLARLLTRQAADADGMYCAELVAKAMEAANAPFVVEVDASRIPPAGSADEAAVHAAIEHRVEVWNSFTLGDEGITPPAADYPIERLRSLRESLSNTPSGAQAVRCTRRVGFGDGEFPPSLVSPNDLARSPSFGWSANQSGSNDNEPDLDRPAPLAKVLLLGGVVYLTRRYIAWRTKTVTVPPGPADVEDESSAS